MPLVSRTRAILRNAELGFFGVIVRTCTQTPRLSGLPLGTAYRRWRSALKLKRSAGAAVFFLSLVRPLRTSWLIVGNEVSVPTLPQDQSTSVRGSRSYRQLGVAPLPVGERAGVRALSARPTPHPRSARPLPQR